MAGVSLPIGSSPGSAIPLAAALATELADAESAALPAWDGVTVAGLQPASRTPRHIDRAARRPDLEMARIPCSSTPGILPRRKLGPRLAPRGGRRYRTADRSTTRRIRSRGDEPHRSKLPAVTPLEAIAIFGAGLAAGTINTIVGSGSLITFPTLLAFGFAPLDANVSNTVGLVPGSLSGAVGYRRELAGQRDRAIRLGIA